MAKARQILGLGLGLLKTLFTGVVEGFKFVTEGLSFFINGSQTNSEAKKLDDSSPVGTNRADIYSGRCITPDGVTTSVILGAQGLTIEPDHLKPVTFAFWFQSLAAGTEWIWSNSSAGGVQNGILVNGYGDFRFAGARYDLTAYDNQFVHIVISREVFDDIGTQTLYANGNLIEPFGFGTIVDETSNYCDIYQLFRRGAGNNFNGKFTKLEVYSDLIWTQADAQWAFENPEKWIWERPQSKKYINYVEKIYPLMEGEGDYAYSMLKTWEYLLDVEGNIVQDVDGNDIKVAFNDTQDVAEITGALWSTNENGKLPQAALMGWSRYPITNPTKGFNYTAVDGGIVAKIWGTTVILEFTWNEIDLSVNGQIAAGVSSEFAIKQRASIAGVAEIFYPIISRHVIPFTVKNGLKYRLVLSYDESGSLVNSYINGIAKATGSTTGTAYTTRQINNLLSNANDLQQLNGFVGRWTIYDYVASDAELQQIKDFGSLDVPKFMDLRYDGLNYIDDISGKVFALAGTTANESHIFFPQVPSAVEGEYIDSIGLPCTRPKYWNNMLNWWSNEKALIAHDASVEPFNSDFTLSAIVRIDHDSANTESIMTKQVVNSSMKVGIFAAAVRQIGLQQDTETQYSGTSWGLGAIVHIAVSYDNVTKIAKYYYNGREVSESVAYTTFYSGNTVAWALNGRQADDSLNTRYVQDEYMLHSARKLTESEILDLYNYLQTQRQGYVGSDFMLGVEALWRMNKVEEWNTIDIVPNKAYAPNPIELQSGVAQNFDGATGLIHDNRVLAPQTVLTTAFWVKFDSLTGLTGIIGRDTDTAGNSDLIIWTGVATTRLRFLLNDSSGIRDYLAPDNTPTNQWLRIVAVADKPSESFKVYQNGVLILDEVLTTTFNVNVAARGFVFGSRSSTPTGLMNGQMCDVQVWDAAWTADDVAYDLLNKAKLITAKSGATILNSNLLRHYPFMEGADNNVKEFITPYGLTSVGMLSFKGSDVIPQTAKMIFTRTQDGSDEVLYPNFFGGGNNPITGVADNYTKEDGALNFALHDDTVLAISKLNVTLLRGLEFTAEFIEDGGLLFMIGTLEVRYTANTIQVSQGIPDIFVSGKETSIIGTGIQLVTIYFDITYTNTQLEVIGNGIKLYDLKVLN